MPTKQETREFENMVSNAFDNGYCPMASVYMICSRMGENRVTSKSKFYVKVYRAVERMVSNNKMFVIRGIRDPSVYLPRRLAKGFDNNGIADIPF